MTITGTGPFQEINTTSVGGNAAKTLIHPSTNKIMAVVKSKDVAPSTSLRAHSPMPEHDEF